MRPSTPDAFWDHVAETIGPMSDAQHVRHGCSCGLLIPVIGQDGTCEFFKGSHQIATADTFRRYGREFDRLRLIPLLVEEFDFPAPTIGDLYEDDQWRIVAYQGFATLPTARPWNGHHVTAAMSILQRMSQVPTGPATAHWPRLDQAEWALGDTWQALDEADVECEYRDDIDGLLMRLPEALRADQHVHGSAYQPHHFLLESTESVLVDWADAAIGPSWVDAVDILIGATADGQVSLTTHLMHPLFDGVPADHIDAWLASRLGFFVDRVRKPLGSAAPQLNQVFAWYAGATYSWLAKRRGWHT